ncbi:hypothetical protein IAT40_001094 [Kwoniella sp. CBS 6097]
MPYEKSEPAPSATAALSRACTGRTSRNSSEVPSGREMDYSILLIKHEHLRRVKEGIAKMTGKPSQASRLSITNGEGAVSVELSGTLTSPAKEGSGLSTPTVRSIISGSAIPVHSSSLPDIDVPDLIREKDPVSEFVSLKVILRGQGDKSKRFKDIVGLSHKHHKVLKGSFYVDISPSDGASNETNFSLNGSPNIGAAQHTARLHFDPEGSVLRNSDGKWANEFMKELYGGEEGLEVTCLSTLLIHGVIQPASGSDESEVAKVHDSLEGSRTGLLYPAKTLAHGPSKESQLASNFDEREVAKAHGGWDSTATDLSHPAIPSGQGSSDEVQPALGYNEREMTTVLKSSDESITDLSHAAPTSAHESLNETEQTKRPVHTASNQEKGDKETSSLGRQSVQPHRRPGKGSANSWGRMHQSWSRPSKRKT